MKQAGIPTKIIIMTGHPLTDDKETIMALGVEGWLDKPPSLEKLGQAIWYALL